jgi:hypothetical protein
VDEFQSFTTRSFASMLSEARKYRLCLTLSHQYMGQLQEGVLDAVLGNVGSIAAFRVGHQDAKSLQDAFGGTYSADHFATLNNRELYAKTLSSGEEVQPFHGRTLPPFGVRHGRRDSIIRRSRERYSTKREVIEERIRRWLNQTR